MATYGWPDLIVKVDNTDGGSLTNISAYVRAITIGKRMRLTEENTYAGLSWEAHLLTGIRKMEPITLEGVYDDTASTGPKAIFGTSAHTVTRSFEFTLGGSNTIAGEAFITEWDPQPPSKGKITWKAVLLPTLTITEA